MELEGNPIIAQGSYSYGGVEVFHLAAGGKLKIDTTGGGRKILEETVPAGKEWTVRLTVHIVERDV